MPQQPRASLTVHCVFRLGAQALGKTFPVRSVRYVSNSPAAFATNGSWLPFALRIRKRSDRPDRFESENHVPLARVQHGVPDLSG